MDWIDIRTIVAASVCLPSAAVALGLGNIEVKSGLHQRLDAEIEIVGATPADLERLSATLASREQFASQGVDYAPAFGSIEIQPRRNQQGNVVLHLTSGRSIVEPISTLVIEADWARGRMQRTYTILLDPPGFGDAVEPPALAVATRSRSTARATRPVPAAPAPPRADAVSTERPEIVTGAQYGPVRRGESLWKIALRVRPVGADLDSTMAAIYEANPGAFAGSMDRLKAGAMLRVPVGDGEPSASTTESSSVTETPAVAASTGQGSRETLSDTAAQSQSMQAIAPAASADPAETVSAPVLRRQLDSTLAQNAELSAELDELNAQIASTTAAVAQRDAAIESLRAQLVGLQRTETIAAEGAAPAADTASAVGQAPVARNTTAASPAGAGPWRLSSIGSALLWFALGALAAGLLRRMRRPPASEVHETNTTHRAAPTASRVVPNAPSGADQRQRPVPTIPAVSAPTASPSDSRIPRRGDDGARGAAVRQSTRRGAASR
jgi:pilus assembly protein FimV